MGVGSGGRVVSRGGGVVSAERFYAPGMDRRIVYPGVAVPRAAGLRIGLARPVYYHGRRVVAHVPHCGFGFFTPVVPVAYPVPVYEPYPVPVYSSTTIVTPPPVYQPEVYGPPPAYADGGYGYADGGYEDGEYASGGYENGGYGGAPAYAGQPGQPPAQAPAMPMGDDRAYTQEQPIAQPPPEIPPAESPVSGPEDQPVQGGDGREGQPTQAEQQMAEGMEAFATGDYDKAGRAFLQIGMADNDNIDAWLAYAVARFATRDYEAAALAVRRAIRAFPDVVNSPVDIRERYGKPEDFDRHLAAAEEHVRNRPEDGDALLTLGFVQHFSRGRESAGRTFTMLNQRFEADREIANVFLKAKPLSEIEREMQESNGDQGNGGPDQAPMPEGSQQPAPPPPPPLAGEQSSRDPVGSALQAEQNLRDSGLTR